MPEVAYELSYLGGVSRGHLCISNRHLRNSSISSSDNYGIHNTIQWFNQVPGLTFKFSLYNIHTDASQI